MLWFVRNMKIFCLEDLFWFQSYWSRDILHGNFRLFYGNYMVVIHTVFTNLTLLRRICWRVCSPTVTYDWFPVLWITSWPVPHVGQEMHTPSGTPDFIPFGEFTISPIHYIYIIYLIVNLSALGLCLQVNNSGLFAWISLTALSRTYFIITIHFRRYCISKIGYVKISNSMDNTLIRQSVCHKVKMYVTMLNKAIRDGKYLVPPHVHPIKIIKNKKKFLTSFLCSLEFLYFNW